jgi:hypothetical protein
LRTTDFLERIATRFSIHRIVAADSPPFAGGQAVDLDGPFIFTGPHRNPAIDRCGSVAERVTERRKHGKRVRVGSDAIRAAR